MAEPFINPSSAASHPCHGLHLDILSFVVVDPCPPFSLLAACLAWAPAQVAEVLARRRRAEHRLPPSCLLSRLAALHFVERQSYLEFYLF